MNEIVMTTFPTRDYINVTRRYMVLNEQEIIEIDKFSKENNVILDVFKFQGTKTESEFLAFSDPRDKSPVCMEIGLMEKLRKEGKI